MPKHHLINCNGKPLDLSTPAVMGIINSTPDSFYAGSRAESITAILQLVGTHLEQGASIIDIGGQSTRPGATWLSAEEEAKRVLPAVAAISKAFPEAILSVDTFYASVAKDAAAAGADMINDVSGGQFDDQLFGTLAELQLPYVLMHTPGKPEVMQENMDYIDVVADVISFLRLKLAQLEKLGVTNVIIDPGFGFGKTLEQNYQLLNGLDKFLDLGKPLLCGISRKSMVNKVLNTRSIDSLNGTTILNTLCVENGAKILRVHDVAEAMEVVKIYSFARTQSSQ
jgi:dihydropteroate synthase